MFAMTHHGESQSGLLDAVVVVRAGLLGRVLNSYECT
jgi:hypothetical protein